MYIYLNLNGSVVPVCTFRVLGFGFWVLGPVFLVLGFVFCVLGFGFCVLGVVFWVVFFGFCVLCFGWRPLQGPRMFCPQTSALRPSQAPGPPNPSEGPFQPRKTSNAGWRRSFGGLQRARRAREGPGGLRRAPEPGGLASPRRL